MTAPCAAAVPTEAGWSRCGAESVATYAYACIHEHVLTASTCAEHQPQGGIVGCRRCWDAGHECLLTIVAVPQ